jgi:hypothetical protein
MSEILDMPVPSTTPETITRAELDTMVRNWREAKAARLELQKQVDKIEDLEKTLKQFIMDAIDAQRFEGLVSDGRVTRVTTKVIPICNDPSATWDYIFEHKATDLVSFRLSTKAAELRMADGIAIPGVSTIEKQDLSDKKV